MDQIKTGLYIAKLRKEKKLTQEQFGEILGVTNKTVSRWETGVYMPDIDTLKVMSDFFGISINEIISGEVYEKGQKNNTETPDALRDIKRRSVFTRKEYTDYLKRKWKRDHILTMIVTGILILSVFALLVLFLSHYFLFCVPLAAFFFRLFYFNQMMEYIEKKTYSENLIFADDLKTED